MIVFNLCSHQNVPEINIINVDKNCICSKRRFVFFENTRRIHKYVLSCGHEKHVTKAVYEKLYTACTVVKTGLNESIVKDCFPGT